MTSLFYFLKSDFYIFVYMHNSKDYKLYIEKIVNNSKGCTKELNAEFSQLNEVDITIYHPSLKDFRNMSELKFKSKINYDLSMRISINFYIEEDDFDINRNVIEMIFYKHTRKYFNKLIKISRKKEYDLPQIENINTNTFRYNIYLELFFKDLDILLTKDKLKYLTSNINQIHTNK